MIDRSANSVALLDRQSPLPEKLPLSYGQVVRTVPRAGGACCGRDVAHHCFLLRLLGLRSCMPSDLFEAKTDFGRETKKKRYLKNNRMAWAYKIPPNAG